MKILILSYNFPPDISAGAFRVKSFIQELEKELDEESHVDVITTTPNRYENFKSYDFENNFKGLIHIKRINVNNNFSGFIGQVLGFLKYSFSTLNYTRRNDYNLVFSTSSKLMTGFLGAVISNNNAKFYLDIRDIFTETLEDVITKKLSFFLLPIIFIIERYTMQRAAKVNLVSRGFEPYFLERFPNKDYSYNTNGIDSEFLSYFSSNQKNANTERKIANRKNQSTRINILYAGNIGEGQGLEKVIPELAIRIQEKARFKIIGDGVGRHRLKNSIEQRNIKNIKLIDPLDRQELLHEYLKADVLFIHLNNYQAFKRVLPSKIFEYAATGLPIWAGVDGYCKLFLEENVENVRIFKPCDVDGAIDEFYKLEFRSKERKQFMEKFSRTAISQNMAREFLQLNTG